MNPYDAGRPVKHRIPWGEVRVAWDRGDSAQAIADRFGIARQLIYSRVHYHDWPNRARGINGSRVDLEHLERLWAAGVRAAEIADRLGIALSYVGTLARRLNLPRRPVVRTRIEGRPMPRAIQLRQPALQLARCERMLAEERERDAYLPRRCQDCRQRYTGPRCPGCQDRDTQGAA